MGCACNKNKTVYIVTTDDGAEEFTDRTLALARARIKGGTITSKVVPK